MIAAQGNVPSRKIFEGKPDEYLFEDDVCVGIPGPDTVVVVDGKSMILLSGKITLPKDSIIQNDGTHQFCIPGCSPSKILGIDEPRPKDFYWTVNEDNVVLSVSH